MSSEELIQALQYLSGGLKMRSLYPSGHPAIIKQVEKAYDLISDILKTEKKLTIAMAEELFIIQNEPFYEASELFENFLNMFKEKGAEKITFYDGLTREELTHLFDIFASPIHELSSEGGLHAAFESRGMLHIVLERLEKEKRDLDLLARKIYSDSLDVLTDVFKEVRLGKIPKVDHAKKVISEMVEVVLEDRNAILGLSMIKGYDDYLFNHSVNVSILSVSLGEYLELPESTLNELGIGALLHDIGKVYTSENIVKKVGKLDDKEWVLMKRHPILGHEVLIKMSDLHGTSSDIAFEHHLKYSGSGGYPEEAMKREPNPCSQIVTIADFYDAVTTLRPYRTPSDPFEALHMMEKLSGTTFRPDYLEAFVKMLGIYPAGTLVRLNTNEIAVIHKPNSTKPLSPEVKILFDAEGNMFGEPPEVDLMETGSNGRPKRTIMGTVSPLIKNIEVSQYL